MYKRERESVAMAPRLTKNWSLSLGKTQTDNTSQFGSFDAPLKILSFKATNKHKNDSQLYKF